MVWPAIIGAGASLLGGLVSAAGASRAQDRSEGFSREMYEYALTHGPSLEMEGLRRAGINPMLRYGTGGQGTPVSMPTMSFQNAFGDLGAGIAGMGSSAFALERQSAETNRINTELLLKLPEELESIRANTALTEAQRESALQQKRVLVEEEIYRHAQTSMTIAQIDALEAQVRQMETAALLNLASAAAQHANAALSNLALSRAEYDSEFFESWFGEIVRGVHNTIGGMGPLQSGSGGSR